MAKKKAAETEYEYDPAEEFESPAGWTEYKTPDEARRAIDDYFLRSGECHQQYYGEADLALGINVSLDTLRGWKNGERGEGFKAVADRAYLRIAAMFETNALYNEDRNATRKAALLMKQPWFQGYQEKSEEKKDVTVNVIMGEHCDKSDFM